jgi:hypothetical protein
LSIGKACVVSERGLSYLLGNLQYTPVQLRTLLSGSEISAVFGIFNSITAVILSLARSLNDMILWPGNQLSGLLNDWISSWFTWFS